MAIFKFGLPQPGTTTDMLTLVPLLYSFGSTQVSSTFFRDRTDAQNYGLLKGSGLVWQIDPFSLKCVAGEFNSLKLVTGGDTIWEVTGLNVSAKAAITGLSSSPQDFLNVLLSGNDRIFGTSQADILFGANGGDALSGKAGDDSLSGGAGRDTIRGGGGQDTINGDGGNDVIFGGPGGAGNPGYNYLNGGNGNDVISGSVDLDYQDGGAGNDTLVGALFFDTLTGGTGADDFVFRSTANLTNNPFIYDFGDGADEILLDNDRFRALGAPGDLKPSMYREGANATDATDRIIYDPSNGRLWYDPDGAGGQGKKLITIVFDLDPMTAFVDLSAADFRVIG